MRKERRWKLVALLVSGMLVGVVMVGTPAGAHVTNWTHNWSKHIRPKADARYYTKAQANERYTNRAASARVDEGSDLALPEYPLFATVVETTLATKGASSKVLVVGQFTAQNTTANAGDLLGQLRVDGAVVDGMHWSSLGHTGPPVFPRSQLAFSRVVAVGPGPHSIVIQGAYYDGGTDQTVQAYARTVSAVELN